MIPNMVGVEALAKVKYYAQNIKEGYVVEVGPWLGACTVEVLEGLGISDHPAKIHVYDKFKPSGSEVAKADKFGVQLCVGKSSLKVFQSNVLPHLQKRTMVVVHCGDIREAKYCGEPIGLFMDDASKREDAFRHTVSTFFPYILPRAIVILMDYWYFLKAGPKFKYQHDWMSEQERLGTFKYIESVPNTSIAIFQRTEKGDFNGYI
jgi:hypothetical protein